ncbi:V(D)J recombination-activating protein 1-like [Corticium candelabrum]|uniref:V(D)J recombination-activating protein 1-like n=1 Tax=Corticium candelabrum TaxID=121492 RepID=UPI002E264980|nr:V(D)J recombination-activating protein 1-like [Corticium candelabrum]
MEHHILSLRELRRSCGSRFNREDRRYKCLNHKDRILQLYKIDVGTDDVSVHPTNFCVCCHLAMHRFTKRQGASVLVPLCREWMPHSENCNTCSSCQQQKKGERLPKTVKKNRLVPTGQPAIKLTDLIRQIETVAPEALNQAIQLSNFIQSESLVPVDLFECPVCEKVVNSPVEFQCNHLVCKKCAIQHLHQSPLYDCPQCQLSINKEHLKSPSAITLASLASLQITCSNPHCNNTMRLDRLQQHYTYCSKEGGSDKEEMPTPLGQTLGTVLASPLTQTPNTIEKRTASNIVRRMVNSSCEDASDYFVSLKTRGRLT